MATVEFTGFEMTRMKALGQYLKDELKVLIRYAKGFKFQEKKNSFLLFTYLAHPVTKFLTIPALILKRSSRDIPGFLGTPAGITTKSEPVKAAAN